MTSNILIVDDEKVIRGLETRLLEGNGYICTQAASAEEARAHLKRQAFDLALIDITMPGESGLSLARSILDEYLDTATLMVTGIGDLDVARHALEIGTYGYVVKPFAPRDLLVQVAAALQRRERERGSRAHEMKVEQALRERTSSHHEIIAFLGESENQVEELILRLAATAEYRDDETTQHVHRMSHYCALLTRRMGWNLEQCKQLRLVSTLHDIGKVGIPDHILYKPGPLTAPETIAMREHAEIGYRLLAGSRIPLLQTAANVAWTHHEKFDGSGYPRGLAGDAIPVEGRVAAIADVFDALTSDRVYRPAYPLEKALAIMRSESGQHFDPSLLTKFLKPLKEVLAIREQFPDKKRCLV